ncbi:MAG TPA: DUF4190 domain-containing protein [Solirubrobacteraceae bacterium]|nr:DUF4190 domain-containing protein [Solirubrobacteraceae bacterium]
MRTSPPPPPSSPPPAAPPSFQPASSGGSGQPGIAIAGFVCGLLGLLLSWCVFLGIPLSIIGIVLSITGRNRARERGVGTGMATAGLVCGVIGLVLALLLLAIGIANTSFSTSSS